MKKTPLALVKERFESKEKLVEAIRKLATPELWLDRVSDTLDHAPNAKLLKLHDLLVRVGQEHGSRARLVTALLEAEGRTKDTGLRARYESYPLPRLWDAYQAATKRRRRAEKRPKAPAVKKKTSRSRKAQAKVRAARAA